MMSGSKILMGISPVRKNKKRLEISSRPVHHVIYWDSVNRVFVKKNICGLGDRSLNPDE